MATKHIFPLVLDAAPVTRTNADSSNIDITTSATYIAQASGGAVTPTLPDGTVDGQLMSIIATDADGSNKTTITITTPRAGHFNTILIDAIGEGVICVWHPDGWMIVSALGGVTLSTS